MAVTGLDPGIVSTTHSCFAMSLDKRLCLMVFQPKLQIELVPKPLWGLNLRSADGLGKARWDKLRKGLVEASGARCKICGGTKKLHGHEVWVYRDRKITGTALLLRVEIVCINCHDIHHWARTVRLIQAGIVKHNRYMALRKHFRKVNGCRQKDFDDYFLRSLRSWNKRSKKKWKIDWGSFREQIEAAEEARKKWKKTHSRCD